jgi:hypothetical protein
MATTAAPYGLRPINLIGGQVFAGSTRMIKIASGYATNIFNGDIVAVGLDGTIAKVTNVGSDADEFPAGTVGVFLGCQYTDPSLKYLLNNNYWPANTVSADALAVICDDPQALFQIQADGELAQTDLHKNFPVVQTAGDTATGRSKIALDASEGAVTATIAFKVVDFVNSVESQVGDAFTDVIVKFNPSSHAYTAGLGVADPE